MPNKNQNIMVGSNAIREKLSHAAKNLRRNTERVRSNSAQRDEAILINQRAFSKPTSGQQINEIQEKSKRARLSQAASKFLK